MSLHISRDDGVSWEAVELPQEPADIYTGYGDGWLDFGFTSPENGWIAVPYKGQSNQVYEPEFVSLLTTQNGGKTWRQTAKFKVSSYGCTQFVTTEHGYMGAHAEQGGPLLETWDGGATWQPCSISLPAGLTGGESNGRVMEFLQSEQGIYCVFYMLFAGADELSPLQDSVQLALTPHQNGEITDWRVEESWGFPYQTDPVVFFRYLNGLHFNPGFDGAIYNRGQNSLAYEGKSAYLDDKFQHYINDYALKYRPESINEVGVYYHLSEQLVIDILSLMYNSDFDVTTLADYNPGPEGGTISTCTGGHCGSHQDALYYSVRTTDSGDIELVRDIFLGEIGTSRGSTNHETQVQRCVFRPVTSASGVEMFTLLECENLEDYLLAA